MKISRLIYSVLFFSFMLVLYLNLVAFDDGIVGYTRKNGNTLGCTCHELDPDSRVSVLLDGPLTVVVNDTVTFYLRISGGPDVEAGCDIATSMGKVIASPLDTMLRTDEPFPGAGFELTHKDPKPFTGPFVEYIFRYIAPSTPNVTDTIFANGNSVNHDGTSFNDRWNFADNFTIEIMDRPMPVELASFIYSVSDNDVLLSWTTLSEENNSGFEIERSDASGSWIKSGFVKGQGHSGITVTYSFADLNLMPGKYNYRLKQIDFNGNFKYYAMNGEVFIGNPAAFKLSQNFPNPFNPSTQIKFTVKSASKILLNVFDLSGKEVKSLINEYRQPGEYTETFDGNNLSSGVYFYSLYSDGMLIDTKKCMLVK